MMNNRQMSETRASSFYGDDRRLEIPAAWKRRRGDDGTAGAVVVNRPKRPTRPGAIALSVV